LWQGMSAAIALNGPVQDWVMGVLQ